MVSEFFQLRMMDAGIVLRTFNAAEVPLAQSDNSHDFMVCFQRDIQH